MLAIRQNIINPLVVMTAATNLFVRGDYSARMTVGSQNEFGELSTSFNNMAETIQMREIALKDLNLSLEQKAEEADAAREQAERSDQVKSSFLASMSHELRTPLNAVINFTKFVAQGDLGPVNEDQRDTLNESIDSAKHLLNLINDVLDMSKIESGSMSLFVQDDISIQEILTNTIASTKTFLKDKPQVELRTEIAPELPKLRGDKQRIRQIILNMLSNACKFTEAGYIEIRAKSEHGEIILTVKDTGPGIAPADQEAVFQAFKQSTTGLRQGGGTGLGMPISKNLAEIHGGRLWLESAVGQGASFYLALPIKSESLIPLMV
jgi:signal transduction histidine kinase